MNEDNITIYNKYYDRENGFDKYIKTTIYNVDWQGNTGMKLNEKRGLLSDDIVNVYIDYNSTCNGKQYLKPKIFEQLSNIEKNNYFTFNNGDVIVFGIIDFELNGKNLKRLRESYDDVVTVTKIKECNLTRHWELECN